MTARPHMIGTRLGVYEIQALLGSGGMATVYRGLDTSLQRVVAIKVLSATAAAQPDFLERFLQEARLIASLRHPHIVHVYMLGEQDGLTYMVQELLPGPTLDEWLADLTALGELPSREDVLTIVAQLASALDAAHAAGVVHRDVKPSNAMWNADGALVLTDFGIAKQLLGSADLTQTGLVVGTPAYLAPEQAQGLPLSGASDIYSLGVVLYQLISGTVPFNGTTPMQVVLDHIRTPPPPLISLRPDLPEAVDAVVQRALAKDPAARFSTAGELVQALEQVWSPSATPVTASTDIHSQATRVWPGATVGGRKATPVSTGSALPGATTSSVAARPATPPAIPRMVPAPRGDGGSRLMLPLLGALLLLLLLAGVVMVLRGGSSTAATQSPTAAAISPVAQATVASAAVTAPAVQMTAQAKTPTTAETPATTTEPLAELRGVLEAGAANGQTGTYGSQLITTLEAVQQALTSGDTASAERQMYELQKTLIEGMRQRQIAPEFARKALGSIEATATSTGLKLPLSLNLNPNGDEDDKAD